MNAPCEDVAGMLLRARVGTRIVGADWQITQGDEMQPSPDRTIHVQDRGGFDPDPRWQIDRPTVQVTVRGAPGDQEYPVARAKAEAVKAALLGRPAEAVGDTRYIGIWMMGDINPTGKDANGRPRFSLNFRLERSGVGGYRGGTQ